MLRPGQGGGKVGTARGRTAEDGKEVRRTTLHEGSLSPLKDLFEGK
jgi:hypothetical protein